MNVVIDMNLSPSWAAVPAIGGHRAIHWSGIGEPGAKDSEILLWARRRRYLVFTHDLDFGALLAATNANAPSVLQVRTQDPTPGHCGKVVLAVLHHHRDALEKGALLTIDEARARVRLLPIRGKGNDG